MTGPNPSAWTLAASVSQFFRFAATWHAIADSIRRAYPRRRAGIYSIALGSPWYNGYLIYGRTLTTAFDHIRRGAISRPRL